MYKIKDLTGTYKAKAIKKSDWVIENTDKIVSEIRKQLEAQGGEIDRIEDNILHIKESTQFVNLPKLPKIREGTIRFRSKDFIFTYIDSQGKQVMSYCTKPKTDGLRDFGFVTYDFRDEETEWHLSKEANHGKNQIK